MYTLELPTKLQNNPLSQARGHSLPKPERTKLKSQHIKAKKKKKNNNKNTKNQRTVYANLKHTLGSTDLRSQNLKLEPAPKITSLENPNKLPKGSFRHLRLLRRDRDFPRHHLLLTTEMHWIRRTPAPDSPKPDPPPDMLNHTNKCKYSEKINLSRNWHSRYELKDTILNSITKIA